MCCSRPIAGAPLRRRSLLCLALWCAWAAPQGALAATSAPLAPTLPPPTPHAPLLHLGALDTAEVAPHGGVWLSGLTLVWGALPRTHLAVDLAESAGLNRRLAFNPTMAVRVQVLRGHLAGATLRVASGVRGQLRALNGQRRTTVRTTYADEGGGPTFRVLSEEVVATAIVRPWADRTAAASWDATATVRDRFRFAPLVGWRATAWVASTVQITTTAGGQLGWHTGAAVSLHPQGWSTLPAWRAWTGVDFDLGRARLFGAISWDPDQLNGLTGRPGLQVDLGLIWSWTQRFRTVFHVQPTFVGFLWQLR